MIQLDNIQRHYKQGSGTIQALRGLSLRIAPGEFVAIMGSSGSGKSTLLNILGALDKPSAGSYRLNGIEVGEMDDDAASALRSRQIGFVFQSFHLLPRLTVLENVLLPQRYLPEQDPEAPQRARALLERMGLGHRIDHRPGELSGGQLQRAAIARALLNQPSLLLADEPTGNLDSKSATDVLHLFSELHSQGQTIVLVTHDPNVAAKAQRTILLNDGNLVSA
ncbi:ABC transporter ATP-binding protein [Undibacterium luofuense]|uniref:ABC transporter ATP-binding protein n=1 Tax=Undibacterium luofuense TaxID=2828733 RepID=A0A941DMR4_9BURK|nr:ABC transporter ATP-binding protein [Undibacterium luofuense]MBR7782645.1 ABC transporter ATP-binding protein [Undibacterium luofuense]